MQSYKIYLMWFNNRNGKLTDAEIYVIRFYVSALRVCQFSVPDLVPHASVDSANFAID